MYIYNSVNQTALDSSVLVADDKWNVTQTVKFFYETSENVMGKEENIG